MRNMEEALTKIMNDYETDRRIAHKERDEAVKRVNEACPEIKNIDEEISRLGIENMGNILKNPEKSAEYNNIFEKNLENLKKKKLEILEKNNIDKDYDKVKYKCEMCLDTGYIDTKKCPCFIKKLAQMRYKLSNMGGILNNFEDFSFDYYGNNYIESIGMTEKENIKDIYRKALDFCDNEDAKNLMFYGGCGLGKTFLSSCIAKKVMDSGKSVIYLTASGLFADYEDYKYGRKDASYFEDMQEMIYESYLLIIDDLGAEAENASTLQFLFDIINKRILEKKKIIISTNLNLNGIKKRYTERIYSRILESFSILRFEGKDIRIQKLRRGDK